MITNAVNDAVELLRILIRIPAISRDELLAADALQHYIEASGIETFRSGNNVWCICPQFDTHKPTLLLNSHIDTVKPASGWQREPFTPKAEGERIYGLGSNDACGCVVSLFEAFKILTAKEQSYNLIYLASCEEEVSGSNGIESILPNLPPITCAIVGEPTEMQPAIAEKGLMVLDITTFGKSGHAAREEGDNAIYKALNNIQKLRDYTFEKVSPLLGKVKMTTTVINAGTQHNVIPDKCSFVVDVRSNELYSNREIYEIISQLLPSSEVKARSFRLNSSNMSLDHPLVKKALAMGKTPYGSPTLSDQCFMNFPSLKIGPGCSSRSHTADEFITIPEIEQGITEYVKLLDGLHLQ